MNLGGWKKTMKNKGIIIILKERSLEYEEDTENYRGNCNKNCHD